MGALWSLSLCEQGRPKLRGDGCSGGRGSALFDPEEAPPLACLTSYGYPLPMFHGDAPNGLDLPRAEARVAQPDFCLAMGTFPRVLHEEVLAAPGTIHSGSRRPLRYKV